MSQSKQQHLKIGELSKLTEVSVSALRYYEEVGILKPIHKEENNYRYYSTEDISIVSFIKKSQHLGFSLEQIKNILREREQGHSPCPTVKKIAQVKIQELRKKIKELETLEYEIKDLILKDSLSKDTNPKAGKVCDLIDKVNL